MSVLGNIIWLVFGGFFMALEYLVSGFLSGAFGLH